MIGLFDRDVFLKLCCCGLFDEALAALGVTQPFRLVSTSSTSSNKSIIKRKLQDFDFAPIMARIAKAVASVPTISNTVADGIRETDIYRRLTNLDDIDSGEQILAAILLSDPRSGILISGDKRFFQAFAHALPAEWLRCGIPSYRSKCACSPSGKDTASISSWSGYILSVPATAPSSTPSAALPIARRSVPH